MEAGEDPPADLIEGQFEGENELERPVLVFRLRDGILLPW